MQIGMPMSYAGGFAETVEELRAFEAAGREVSCALRAVRAFDGRAAWRLAPG